MMGFDGMSGKGGGVGREKSVCFVWLVGGGDGSGEDKEGGIIIKEERCQLVAIRMGISGLVTAALTAKNHHQLGTLGHSEKKDRGTTQSKEIHKG